MSMNSQARQRLCEIVAQWGPSICDDPKRCEGLLRDLCGQHRAEINVLLTAQREGVVAALKTASEGTPAALLLARLTKQLHELQGLVEDIAGWAVGSWALAVGRVSELELASFEGAQNLPEARRPPPQPFAQQAATIVRENPKDGLKYVWIPPGTFMMGCSPGDSKCYDDEKPSHRVTISKGFWIGQTPVTVAAYKRFAAATGRQMPPARGFNRGWADDKMPIINVTWDEAREYCTWAGGRLPTEAEWEYAARGGSTEARYGNIAEIAWCRSHWYKPVLGQRTYDVAQFRANSFGLFDVLGNVFEWVNDWYDDEYYRNSPSQDPPGPTSGQYRVLRGGSWDDNPMIVRVSYRGRFTPGDRGDNGLRCGREVE